MTPCVFYLIRHAHSCPSEEIPHQNWPLSAVRKKQAQLLSLFLTAQKITALYSSPYLRAVDTVTPFAELSNLSMTTIPELRERDFSPEMLADFHGSVERCFHEPAWKLGAGESNKTVAKRVSATLGKIADEHPGERVAIVSHGQALSAYLSTLNRDYGRQGWLAMGNPDIFRVLYENGSGRWDGISLRSELTWPEVQ